MAYTPNEWGVGNLITASKMNKIERQLVANTSDLDDIRNGVTVPTYEEFEALRDDVASEYDNTKTYAVGDYVIYNTQLYKCKTAITSAETWTAAHWDAVEVGEELQRIEGKNEEGVTELKSALEVETTLSGWEKGGFDTANGTNYADNSRISNQTKVGESTGVKGFKLADGYSTLMYAWDLSGTYVGAYKTDGTWTKTISGWKSVTEFNLSTVPNYVIKFAMTRVPSSVDITPDEGSNAIFYSYTDDTLTKAKKAADAKKVGDELGNLSNALNDKVNLYTAVDYSVTGKRVNTDGTIVSDNNCRRTDYYPCVAGTKVEWKGKSFIYQSASVMCLIAFYNSDRTFISGVKKISDETTSTDGIVQVTAPENTAYVIFSTFSTTDYYAHVYDFEADIKSLHEQIYENVTTTWEIGTILSDGTLSDSTTRIRSDFIYAIDGSTITSTGNQIGLFYYDNSKNFDSSVIWRSDSATIAKTGYVKILLRKSDDRTIDDIMMAEMVVDTMIKVVINSSAIGAVNDRQNFERTFSASDITAGTLINGKHSASTSRIYTTNLIPVKTGDKIFFNKSYNSNIKYMVVYYDYTFSHTSDRSWNNAPQYTITQDGYIRFMWGTSDYSAISSDDYDDICGTITFISNDANQIQTIDNAVINLTGEVYGFDRMYNYQTKVLQFAGLYADVENADSFVYFTDPHLLSNGDINEFYDTFIKYTGVIKGFFDRTATEFIMCGGDWLEWSDTPKNALYKLNIMQGRMKEIAPNNYYPVFGNHDNNYQGTEELTQEAVNATMFPDFSGAYYKFARTHFTGYVLDTGTDWSTDMTQYRWEQVDWLADRLAEDDAEHSAVFAHILWNAQSDTTITPMMDYVQQLIGAYNSHSTITLNSITYDFTNCIGKVGFILGGHLHTTKSDMTTYSVPIIARTTTKALTTEPTFDLVLADWGNGKLYFVGIGGTASGTATEFDI